MKLRSNLVVLKPDEAVDQTADGIYIQEAWKELPQTATVIEVGSDVKFCKKDDRVFFNRYATVDFQDNLRLAKDVDILIVL